MSLTSAIYIGHIRHRRFWPRAHAFRYPLFMMYLDLDEIPQVFAGRWFWSVERRNLAEFRRSDFHGDPALPLADAVRQTIAAKTGKRPLGPIRLLTHLRYFGLSFNPVSFYYCFAEDGISLECILAEITNTPWRERRAYVLPVADAERHQSALHWVFDKDFHVSPFLPMDLRYDWRLQAPEEDLRIHMDVADDQRACFDATLVMRRQTLRSRSLAMALLRFPMMSLSVLWSIHWQAFLIWCKHIPVYDHPRKREMT